MVRRLTISPITLRTASSPSTAKPVYRELPGWKTDMTKFTSEDQFPQQFKDYIQFLEEQLETPICIISIGPDRDQTIVRK